MADKMVFPIGFDLKEAVDEAGKEWDSIYAKKLEGLIAKRPVNVKLKLDTTKLDSLDAVKKRLAELKIEPITPETKAAIKELTRELQGLARAMEAVSKYTVSRGMASPDAVRAARINEINARSEAKAAVEREKARAHAARAAQAEFKLEQARNRAANAAVRGATATRDANKEFQAQDGYISRLVKRLAVYAGFSAIRTFLTSVREVTAEFELQRVSLGAIIQDQTRANALFSEIKSFALKSPVSILDLTKYTKQLAAYKIGVDELFETTKKLTDVSVGLGVSLDRAILAYGQTRATGYLRASEIRQFTEMGVPIVEELAAKLSKMNGELVTAAQVMDMVSKRAISFELVKEVFDDMTSAGGIFYNMQEKQGNTLFGLWAKLGDAASVMYDEIGNTDSVNSAMKTTIQLLTDLMKNWREVGNAMMVAGAGFTAIFATNKIKGWQNNIDTARIAANEKYIAASNAYRTAIKAEQTARASATAEEYKAILAKQQSAEASYLTARAEYLAARNTTLLGKAWGKLKAAFLGNWLTILIAGLAAVATSIYNAYEKANRLKNSLREIAEESGIEQMKSVRNFESLANMAVQAADGSRKQKEALEELHRTYKDIIPQERLTIENLREMKGNYDSLTQSIKDYVAEQMKQKQINAIVETTGREMIEKNRKIQDIMKNTYNPEQIARYMTAYEQIIRENPAIEVGKAMEKAAENAGIGWENMLNVRDRLVPRLRAFAKSLKQQITQVDALDSAWNNNYRALGQYGKGYEELINKIKENPIEMGGNADFSENKTPYFFKQQQQNLEILQAMIPTIKQIMSDAGVAWQDGWTNMVTTVDTSQPQIISSIDFDAIDKYLKDNLNELTNEQRIAINKLRNMYDDMIPSNRTTVALRNKLNEIAAQTGVSMDVLRKHLINVGESWEDYSKRVRDAIDDYEKQIEEMQKANAAVASGNGKGVLKTYTDEEIKKTGEYAEALKLLLPFLEALNGKGRGSQSDPRLQTLQEIANKMAEVNKEYDDLLKKEGQTKALADTQKLFAASFKQMQEVANKYKFKLPAFEVPQTVEDVQKWYKAIIDNIKRLNLKNADKVLIELGFKSDKLAIDKQQKDIENKLKELSDKISRTKTAKEFYDKILSTTGDFDLAMNVSMSIYGDAGYGLQGQMAEQIKEMFGGFDVEVPVSVIGANNQVDYLKLEKFVKSMQKELGGIESKTYQELMKIAQEGQKDLAKTYEGYLKDLEKAKKYSDKRIELARYTANQIAEIEASTLPDTEKKRLTAGYKEREDKEAAKLEYEAFKDMPMYVQLFDDLDTASTTMLRNMQTMLRNLKGKWGEALDPTQLREMQSRLNEIGEQLANRNPFKAIGDGIGKIRALHKEYGRLKDVEKELTVATVNLTDHKNALGVALQAEKAAKKEYDNIVAESGADSEAAKAAKSRLDSATAIVKKQKENVDLTEEEVKQLQEIINKFKEANDEIDDGGRGISLYVSKCKEAKNAVQDAVEAWSALGDDEMWNVVMDGLDGMMSAAESAAIALTSSNPLTMVTSGISAVSGLVSTIGNLFYGAKIAKANKEIKKQQELLEQLEYTYGRLEKAADKVFGRDYLTNQQQQLQNLKAQQTAYLKQAEAERSKGKKADKEKIKEYEDAARETADEIEDLMSDLSAHFTGSSKQDVARQMAQSWIEARASISDTFAAIKDDYSEMIKNMIVEGAAARVIENALSPMWDKMDKMLADNDIDGAIDTIIKEMDSALNAANDGMEVLWQALEAKGYDLKQLIGDVDSGYTGIKREVAGATSEEMNANTAALNTQNYYLSQVPGIAANVAIIRQIMETGVTSSQPTASATGWTDWQQQAMDSYLAIQRNTADTVVECRRAAMAAESAVLELQRVVKPRNTSATHSLHVTIDG